ncbi:Rne/Rng family ribonuclease [Bosea sp. (in: a-proteobacteria)]|jgi:ribonuclease E|uniref:ribonuclease E/G n=1 Tax=Bosea sp. (in: a-proteobacteria) TaxID=1871050 RepID=UPI002DDCE264|nr:Rne/Rng family ribonuclease [Bosea sp. (in: a-proteobacteria)]HEV2508021.1 Rne/Rng family ribonuclease [Bosea sp. (in: a-proteobacteria)]
MANKMLIDATHPEETRVVVSRGSRIEEFDFESASRKPLRGNIYLAKVTRVEPSLQAAFVEYGGNRHGFLAFSEIHPDYYQIPVADRQALLAEEARAEREEERDEEKRERRGRRGRRDRDNRPKRAAESGETVSAEVEASGERVETDGKEAAMVNEGGPAFGEFFAPEIAESATEDAAPNAAPLTFETTEAPASEDGAEAPEEARRPAQDDETGDDAEENGGDEAQEEPEQLGGGDALDDMPERPRNIRRQYKIQEVIKRRQIILVQVVKEERGNKGAALTTYLSLAGRYSVLMPNTGKGGGISRKITNAEDRKRLKEIAQELEVPEGMGIILRTAGASRTKPEIRRDYEYLMRMWESVRELTLGSVAPALVYEEGNLVKRSIRDLYNKDIDEVHVAGESAYREAKDFMRMLMPSHAKSVKPYREQTPLFAAFGVESQLDAMFSNTVTLKSGGYIVINQTEALVAIDINSGRSTREHNIEDTALKTNLEAAEEISRQLRLRDLAGLIVIDFIDMEENRNNRAVEKKLKECLKNDRARIQVGRISAFGLLEMSRQRIRTGVLESSSVPCPHCAGAGLVRSTPSIALQILRALEEALIKSASHNLEVRTRPEVALYVLNQKRAHLRDLEERFNITITVSADAALLGTRYFEVERGEFVGNENRVVPVSSMRAEAIIDEPEDEDIVEVEIEAEVEGESEAGSETARHGSADGEGEGESQDGRDNRRRRRRRRRRRGGERDGQPHVEGAADEAGDHDEGEDGDDATVGKSDDAAPVAAAAPVEESAAPVSEAPAAEAEAETKPKRARRSRSKKAETEAATETAKAADVADVATEVVAEPAEKPKRSRSRKKVVPITEDGVAAAPAEAAPAPEPAAPEAVAAPAPEPVVEEAPAPRVVEEPVAVVLTPPDPDRPKRGGWWNKLAGRK